MNSETRKPENQERATVETIRTIVTIEPTLREENGRYVVGSRATEVFPDGHTEVRERDHAEIVWV